ncbi:MAG TPA: PHB depolymerase family esterase [Candidatus Competibacteraceae bacterium]|nr:PHB depolymerase family esterase [Candidatus Competibacteraceae bacterium]
MWLIALDTLPAPATVEMTVAAPAPTVCPPAYPAPALVPTRGIVRRELVTDPAQIYYLYVPPGIGPHAPVLVAVHGVSRNAEEQARRFRRLARQYGVVLVAPLFPAGRFADYQRLGLTGPGARSDQALQAILAEVRQQTGVTGQRMHLFGYSGGGQFVHRYAMAYPGQVTAVAIGAAGWYTFPDAEIRFPHGLKLNRRTALRLQPEQFLRIPMAVFVGERDVRRGRDRPELRQTGRVDTQQGLTRLERGDRWINAMRAAARDRGLDTVYGYEVLSRTTHSFAISMKRGGLGERVFYFLFGPPPRLKTKACGN